MMSIKRARKVWTVIIIVPYVVFGLLICLVLFNKPKDMVINLVEFQGRVFREGEIKPGTFTINANNAEAIKWGKEAILSYGEMGVEIWNPDIKTSGVFQYVRIIGDGNRIYFFEILPEGRSLVVKPYISSLLLGLMVFVLIIVSVILLSTAVVKFREKYNEPLYPFLK